MSINTTSGKSGQPYLAPASREPVQNQPESINSLLVQLTASFTNSSRINALEGEMSGLINKVKSDKQFSPMDEIDLRLGIGKVDSFQKEHAKGLSSSDNERLTACKGKLEKFLLAVEDGQLALSLTRNSNESAIVKYENNIFTASIKHLRSIDLEKELASLKDLHKEITVFKATHGKSFLPAQKKRLDKCLVHLGGHIARLEKLQEKNILGKPSKISIEKSDADKSPKTTEAPSPTSAS